MFTGIIEEVGKIESLKKSGDLLKLKVLAKEISKDANKGDSIAVNGACLTVTDKKDAFIYFDVISKTIENTNLSRLKEKNNVNLEKSLTIDKGISGHLVTGHVDSTGKIIDIRKLHQEQVKICVEVESSLTKFIVSKGSICIDGISLTVFDVKGSCFWVFLTPFTLSQTTLKNKKINDYVNIEVDLIARYLDKIVSKKSNALNRNFLVKYGFLDGK